MIVSNGQRRSSRASGVQQGRSNVELMYVRDDENIAYSDWHWEICSLDWSLVHSPRNNASVKNARSDTLLGEGVDAVHMAVKSSDEFQEPEGWLGEMSTYHKSILES